MEFCVIGHLFQAINNTFTAPTGNYYEWPIPRHLHAKVYD